jgi:hypothetical protein
MQLRQPASMVDFNATTMQTPVASPVTAQPMLSQPQVATPTQAPLVSYATRPANALTTGVTVSAPAANTYTSRVPSLQVSPPVGTNYAQIQPSPAAATVQTAAVTRQPMPASAPRPIARMAAASMQIPTEMQMQPAMPASAYSTAAAVGGGVPGVVHDHPNMPGYAWPSYASHPNYAAVTYPKQYSPTAWPYIGPFYPYPQVPLGWRKVSLEWDDGWWFLDFTSK